MAVSRSPGYEIVGFSKSSLDFLELIVLGDFQCNCVVQWCKHPGISGVLTR